MVWKSDQVRVINDPKPGYFKYRYPAPPGTPKRRKCPWLPALIEYDDELKLWRASICCKPCGFPHEDWRHANGVAMLWENARKIDKIGYDVLVLQLERARQY